MWVLNGHCQVVFHRGGPSPLPPHSLWGLFSLPRNFGPFDSEVGPPEAGFKSFSQPLVLSTDWILVFLLLLSTCLYSHLFLYFFFSCPSGLCWNLLFIYFFGGGGGRAHCFFVSSVVSRHFPQTFACLLILFRKFFVPQNIYFDGVELIIFSLWFLLSGFLYVCV